MQTITDEIGCGPVRKVTYEVGEIVGSFTEGEITNDNWFETGERVAVPVAIDVDCTVGLDNRRQRSELNLGTGPAPCGPIADTVDNGPNFQAANDNDVLARKSTLGTTNFPLKEMYARGELGINELENRRHSFDAEWFKGVHADARGEPDNSRDDWREILLDFFEGFFDNLVTSFETDGGLCLSDDLEFEDSSTPAHCEVVDNSGWDPTRDLAPHAHQLYAQQTVSLLKDVLGSDYQILCAVIDWGWTAREVGETEGFKDRASASACGKGMIRCALRNLSRFCTSLGRLEERGEYSLMKMEPRPALDGLSIGYLPKLFTMHRKTDQALRTLRSVRLIEVSLVSSPSNKLATVQHVKTALFNTDDAAENFMLALAALKAKLVRA